MAIQFPYKRICILGTSASGKTTLSRTLSQMLDIPHIELDALYHGPNWQPPEPAVFQERVRVATRQERWVCDGNYMSAGASQLSNADLAIWLNYPFRIVFGRVIRRTLRRLFTKEELWNGNRESWRLTFFSKESIIWWVITTHRLQKRRLPVIIAKHDIHPLIFTHPRQLKRWLETL